MSKASVREANFCCALAEVGNFAESSVTGVGKRALRIGPWGPYQYAIATTIPTQKHAIAALRKAGWKRLAEFPSNHWDSAGRGYNITLWGLATAAKPQKGAR